MYYIVFLFCLQLNDTCFSYWYHQHDEGVPPPPKKKSRKEDLGLNLLLCSAPEGELAIPGQILQLENCQGWGLGRPL